MTHTATPKPQVSLIAAMSENRVIGRGGELPWHLPDDLKHFKRITTGHTVVMGRKTFDSIGRRPLPGRKNIVVTRDRGFSAAPGVVVVHSLDEALGMDPEVFVLGGGEIYTAAMPRADRIYLTRVHATLDGDAFFPPMDGQEWKRVESVEHSADERHAYAMTFERYERVSPPTTHA